MIDRIIDTNVSLFRWPFRRLFGDETAELVETLKNQHVVSAWTGSLEGVFHRDLAGVNERLARECRERGGGNLVPFGSVNPSQPDWEEDLRRCQEDFKMPGIRLHPNYHGYKLDHPDFAKLLTAAAERDLIVQLAISLEDERQQHPVFRVPHVDASPLQDLVRMTPRLRLQLINVFRGLRPDKAAVIVAAGNVALEIAMLEGVAGIARLLTLVPLERILFGSHFPFFYWQSAQLKLQESGLPQPHIEAIAEANARRWIEPAL